MLDVYDTAYNIQGIIYNNLDPKINYINNNNPPKTIRNRINSTRNELLKLTKEAIQFFDSNHKSFNDNKKLTYKSESYEKALTRKYNLLINEIKKYMY